MAQPEQPSSALQPIAPDGIEPLYGRIYAILTAARTNVARSVNTEMVRAYWLIGREIVEEEQAGQARAAYGKDLIAQISSRLQATFGKGFTATNIRSMRLFYLAYPQLLDGDEIQQTLSVESETTGRLNPNLSWSQYQLLTRITSPYARAFYEMETIHNHWSVRELERQISSLCCLSDWH